MEIRNVTIEKKLLSAIINNLEDGAKIFHELTQEHFTSKELRHLFRIMSTHFKEYQALPAYNDVKSIVKRDRENKQSFRKKLLALLRKLKELQQVKSSQLRYYYNELQKCKENRRLHSLLDNASTLLADDNPSLVEDFIFKGLQQAASDNNAIEVIDFKDNFSERLEEAKTRKDKLDISLKVGIESIDDEIVGLEAGDLMMIVSQTSGGKSVFLQDVTIYNVLEPDKKIFYVTNEMTAKQTAFRMDSRLSEVNHAKFRKGKLKKFDITKWKVSMKDIKSNRLKIVGMHENCTCKTVEAEISKLNFDPDMIVIDYAQNMDPSSGRFTSSMNWEPKSQVIKELKDLALKHRVPVLTAAQIKPEAYEKPKLQMSDIAISKLAISINTDILIALIQTEAMKMRDIATIQFMKVRQGFQKEFVTVRPKFSKIRIHVDK